MCFFIYRIETQFGLSSLLFFNFQLFLFRKSNDCIRFGFFLFAKFHCKVIRCLASQFCWAINSRYKNSTDWTFLFLKNILIVKRKCECGVKCHKWAQYVCSRCTQMVRFKTNQWLRWSTKMCAHIEVVKYSPLFFNNILGSLQHFILQEFY